jgi:hypothetical protein
MKRKVTAVMGHTIPAPRMTMWGMVAILRYVGLPIMLMLWLMDVLGYVIFTHLLGKCYGIACVW